MSQFLTSTDKNDVLVAFQPADIDVEFLRFELENFVSGPLLRQWESEKSGFSGVGFCVFGCGDGDKANLLHRDRTTLLGRGTAVDIRILALEKGSLRGDYEEASDYVMVKNCGQETKFCKKKWDFQRAD